MSCCSPDRGQSSPPLNAVSTAPPTASTTPTRGLITLPGGTFRLGDDGPQHYPADGESPSQLIEVSPFAIQATAVSNDEFAEFVTATGFVTEAEQYDWSFVFGGLLPDDFPDTRGVAEAPWWRQVYGSRWRTPEGPHSTLAERGDHPVVHVSVSDAQAYAAWRGWRLPKEAEWEYACRAGSTTTFWWGDELEPHGQHMMNVFQGQFPAANSAADGFVGTCPVRAFAPNAFGLFNPLGNVWEWTADPWTTQRTNPDIGADSERRTLKGGSYLCHASYCRRYRASARMSSTVDSSAGNIGFRCAADV